jgi:hypothetical protein
VVGEDEVCGQVLAQRSGVPLDPGIELGPRAVLDALDLVAVVAVEHEDRQQPADVRAHRGRTAEVVERRLGLLAEDGDVVPGPRPLPRERARVDVRAGAPEQIAVPEQDPHGRSDPQNEGSCIAASCRYRPHAARTRSLAERRRRAGVGRDRVQLRSGATV